MRDGLENQLDVAVEELWQTAKINWITAKIGVFLILDRLSAEIMVYEEPV